MKENRLSKMLRSMARNEGMCDRFFHEWTDDETVDTLLEKYVSGFDFCVEHDFPSLSVIRENFNTEDLHRHHIYIDEEVNIGCADNGFWVFLGRCTGRIAFGEYAAATVYVRHDSDITVDACDGAIVFVTAFDKSVCNARADERSRIRRYDRTRKK